MRQNIRDQQQCGINLGIGRAGATDVFHLITGDTGINAQLSCFKTRVAQHERKRPGHRQHRSCLSVVYYISSPPRCFIVTSHNNCHVIQIHQLIFSHSLHSLLHDRFTTNRTSHLSCIQLLDLFTQALAKQFTSNNHAAFKKICQLCLIKCARNRCLVE